MDSLNKRVVFFNELDDDFQDLLTLTDEQLHERLVCYYLLADAVVVHPAYVWQSDKTHALIHGPARELLRPPFVQLELGQHATISEYMDRRIDRLRRSTIATAELRAYEAHSNLGSEAQDLSIRFNTVRTHDVSAKRRDEGFRRLLAIDLEAATLDQSSLSSILELRDPSAAGLERAFTIADYLQTFVRDSELVSVDTVRGALYNNGYRTLSEDENFKRRLLALYYQTYSDHETVIPGIHRAQPNSVVNHFDVNVFWMVARSLFGPHSDLLRNQADPAMLRAVREIRERHDWVEFTSTYFDTLGAVDDALWHLPEDLIAKFTQRDPGTRRRFVIRRIWHKRKAHLAGIAFGAVGTPAFGIESVAATAGTLGGIAGMGLVGGSLLIGARRYSAEYRRQNIVSVRRIIKDEVTRAVAELEPEDDDD